MKRICVLVILACWVWASAPSIRADILYNYSWTTDINPVTIDSDNGLYQMQITPAAPQVNQTGGQEVLAATISVNVVDGQEPIQDAFTGKSFNLHLSLDDVTSGASTPAPLTFVVDFNMFVYEGGFATLDTLSLTPESHDPTVGGLDFEVNGPIWTDPKNTDSSQVPGTLTMGIYVTENGNEPPIITVDDTPRETPEPTSLILASIGGLAFTIWRRKRNSL